MMATQKEWELETRIKYLEGTGLQFLYDEYCSKIDQIFQRADKRLEDVRDVPKAKPKPKPAHSDEARAVFDPRMALAQYNRAVIWPEQGLQRGVIGLQGEASLARAGAGAAARGAFGPLF